MKRGYFGFILGLFLLGSMSNFATGYSEVGIHAFTSPPVLSSRAMIEMIEMLLLLGFENHLVL